MTIIQLVLYIALLALLLTGAQQFMGKKIIKNFLVSLLQNFAGGLFIISGVVKAVDPLGTAYKMEQYFAEFQSTFAGSGMASLAPLFPKLAEHANAFSVSMIVLEIVLGVALLLGAAKKLTAWAFFLLVLLFTFLTGFTYLTGYVPEGVNFFSFSQWGAYEPTNMKVTDCGCFGDFIKLEPRISFYKDLFLLIPSLVFLFFNKSFHVLTQGNWRAVAVGLFMFVSVAIIYLTGYNVGWRLLALMV
ncbi:MAG: hypothetical protein R2795_23995, partial [Saprospiraceae bacterium]